MKKIPMTIRMPHQVRPIGRSLLPGILACSLLIGFSANHRVMAGAVPVTVTRAVRVTCAKANPFIAAVAVKNNIDLMGNGVYTDSFNSADPTKSTNGQYDSKKYTGDKGDILTNGGVNSSVNVQNANIYGHVHTGAGCAVSVGPNGAVGTHAWQAGNSGLEPGFVLPDANFTFPDTTFPNTASYLTPTGGVIVVSSNYTTSFSTNVAIFPNPPPAGGVTTNTTPVTVNNWALVPNPVPAGTTTNTSATATVSLWSMVPSPTPGGTTTNTSATTTATYPAPGTYLGAVVTNTHAHSITGYTYNLVTGYTYPTPAYTYPTFSYTYNLYSTNCVWVTNHYDNLLWGSAGATNCYVTSALSGQSIVLGPNVVLALPNGMTGSENLTISPSANILIYSGGTSFSAAGNQIINPNGNAGSFVVYCAPSVTSFTLAGNGQFTGVLVAPYADVTLHGGGNNNQDFSGMLMANSLTLNGHFRFHYDEALQGNNGFGRFIVTSWNEVP